MNPMFNMFGKKQNDIEGIVSRIKQFKSVFQGDPNRQLQQMIDSGQIPQNVLNQAQEMAKPIYDAMKAIM